MKDTRQKKIKQINMNLEPHFLQISIKEEKAYLSIDGDTPKYLDSLSDLLVCLIRNLNHEVTREHLLKQVSSDIEEKTFLNYLDRLRKRFNSYGPKYIVTAGSGKRYTAMFRTDEHCEIIYDEDTYETTAEYLMQNARSGKGFSSVDELTGNTPIRDDLLPACLCSGVTYTSLRHLVYHVFMNNPLTNSLILHGDGGAGKTFSLYDTYRAGDTQGVRTIYLHADTLDRDEHNLARHIAQRYLKVSDYHQQIMSFETFVQENTFPILLLIDGLNEISDSGKLKSCIQNFRALDTAWPGRFHAVFATRYPQAVKALLGSAQSAELQPLTPLKFKDINQEMLKKLHIELTPLIKLLMEDLAQEDASGIHSRYDLYCRYFDHLTVLANKKDGTGWIYPVLSAIAASSMEGANIDSRWLKRFCSAQADYDFIHRYCAGEEYPLEDSSTAELLKATGFLHRGRLDTYRIHQQYRDFLTVRYGMLLVQEEEITMSDFLLKMAEATRYYTLNTQEDPDEINARRHNNLDLGEFAFYAGMSYWKEHPQDYDILPHLLQLGIQVAYLYDNVERWTQLFSLYSSLKEIQHHCLASGQLNPLLRKSLPGYYFCLNKLVDKSRKDEELSNVCSWIAFSEQIEEEYLALLAQEPAEDTEWKALLCSGLGGVFQNRYHITERFEDRSSCLSHAVKYHTDALAIRRRIHSPKLYRSYVALGTCYFYKGQLYLSNKQEDLCKEAINAFREAASYHKMAVSIQENTERHVGWSRMAGCWYQILLHSPEEEVKEEAKAQLYTAAVSACNSLLETVSASGAIRHSSLIKSQLLDLSRYMQFLSFEASDFGTIDHLCRLYQQAYGCEKEPYRSEDNKRIIF